MDGYCLTHALLDNTFTHGQTSIANDLAVYLDQEDGSRSKADDRVYAIAQFERLAACQPRPTRTQCGNCTKQTA